MSGYGWLGVKRGGPSKTITIFTMLRLMKYISLDH